MTGRETLLIRRGYETAPDEHSFLVALDTSLGVEGGDPSAGHVWDASVLPWLPMVAYHGWLSHREQAWLVKSLSDFYNNALIVIEENQGHAILAELERMGANLVFQAMVEGSMGRTRTRPGWYSSERTKQRAIRRTQEALIRGEIARPDTQTIMELNTYVLGSGRSGRPMVVPSARIRDDRADAFVMAIDVLTSLDIRVDRQAPENRGIPEGINLAETMPSIEEMVRPDTEAPDSYRWPGDDPSWRRGEIFH